MKMWSIWQQKAFIMDRQRKKYEKHIIWIRRYILWLFSESCRRPFVTSWFLNIKISLFKARQHMIKKVLVGKKLTGDVICNFQVSKTKQWYCLNTTRPHLFDKQYSCKGLFVLELLNWWKLTVCNLLLQLFYVISSVIVMRHMVMMIISIPKCTK